MMPSMMERPPLIDVLPTRAAASAHAAQLLVDGVASGTWRTLGLATGGSVVDIYAGLVEAHQAGKVSFADVTTFNLDEYAGIGPEVLGSFHAFMRRCLFDLVDVQPGRAFMPDGMAGDLALEAARFEGQIQQSGGIDLQLLGIGSNGHIGFNEPGSDFASRTREVMLTQETRVANAAFFKDNGGVPQSAVTMGIATILEAREIMLVAMGAHKAQAIHAAVQGPVSTDWPASALRQHSSVRIICDEAAASLITGPAALHIRRIP